MPTTKKAMAKKSNRKPVKQEKEIVVPAPRKLSVFQESARFRELMEFTDFLYHAADRIPIERYRARSLALHLRVVLNKQYKAAKRRAA